MMLRTRIALYLLGRDFWEICGELLVRNHELEAQIEVDELESSRLALAYCDHFVDVFDDPERWEEQIERLREARVDLADQVARLEEHTL